MDVDRWTHVQTLFEAALDRAPDERSAFLRASCGDDPALYHQLVALLEADAETHPLLDGRALDALHPDDASALFAEEDTDEAVGPWRLGRRVGTGGMGTVYCAERADGAYEQTVALKLIKRGMDSETVLRRFHAERRILARLQHPGIARLVDGGLAPDGRPYFAMEFVEGEPITDYADRRRLSADARLRLFAAVCEAVRYAHRNLVVHRDLKPSNILVTETADGRPEVKLLDFGIARLLADDDDALLTQTGQRILTPAYAAPEQVRGATITTATDVYALGGLLYRLLCGAAPVEIQARSAVEIERAVLETVPPRPSAAVTPEAAEVRSTTPDRLGRRLRGDLDTITMTALHKEPERRYGSAAELLDDLVRYLGDLPITARRESGWYRLRKFVDRHRTGVLTGVTVLLGTILLVGFYTTRLATERDRARTEADKAAEVSAFLASLFESADPAESRGADVTARELLADGLARIEAELDGQPAVQAAMYGTIGKVYQALGLYTEADTALTRSLALYHAIDAESLPIAGAEAALAALRVDQGDFETADSLLRRALAVQDADPAAPPADLIETLDTYAILLQERGDYAASEAPIRRALDLQRALHTGDHETTASLLASLGQTYSDLGQYEDAEGAFDEALAMRRRLYSNLHPAVTESLRLAAALERRLRRYEDAERLILEAIALDSVLVGELHPNMGEDLYEYGSTLNEMSRFDEATAVFERTLRVDRATMGENHPYIALTLNELGQVRQRAGDVDGAIRYYREALAFQRRVLPADHPEIATTLSKLGQALSLAGDPHQAERVLREGLALRLRQFDEDHPAVLSDRSALATLLSTTGRHDEAIAEHRDILARRIRSQGDDSPLTARSYYNLAGALRARGTADALAEARIVAGETVAQYRAAFPAESREMGYALMEQGDVLRASDDRAGAAAAYRQARRAFAASVGPAHPITRRVEEKLSELQRR